MAKRIYENDDMNIPGYQVVREDDPVAGTREMLVSDGEIPPRRPYVDPPVEQPRYPEIAKMFGPEMAPEEKNYSSTLPFSSEYGSTEDGAATNAPLSLPPQRGGARKPRAAANPDYVDAVAEMKKTADYRMPKVAIPEEEDDGVDDSPAALALAAEKNKASLVRPASGAAPTKNQTAPAMAIPEDLLARLRAAQQRDSLDTGTSSLGRLLMATSAGYALDEDRSKQLMGDYLNIAKEQRGQGLENFNAEQKLRESEDLRARNAATARREEARGKRDDEEVALKRDAEKRMDDATTPMARFLQSLAARMGVPNADGITERSGKFLLDVFKIDENNVTKKMQEEERTLRAMSVQELRQAQAMAIEAIRSGDRNAAITASLIRAALAQKEKSDKGGKDALAEVRGKQLEHQIEREFDLDIRRLTEKMPGSMKNSLDTIKELDKMIYGPNGKPKSDLPGVGVFDGLRPGFLAGEKGRDLRQKVEILQGDYIKNQYGVSLSKTEDERLTKALGKARAAGSEKEFVEGYEAVREILRGKLAEMYRGYKPEVVREYVQNRGGHYVPGDPNYGEGGKFMVEPEPKQPAQAAPPVSSDGTLDEARKKRLEELRKKKAEGKLGT